MKKVTQTQKTLFILGIMVASLGVARGVSALTYQAEVTPEFTWNPTLSMDLSSDQISIIDLVPGNSKKSNDITVTVTTNSVAGYKLTATVGKADSGNVTGYNNTKLVNSTVPSAFLTGINYSDTATVTTLTGDANGNGTWGYSTDSGAHYNGLPVYTAASGAVLKTTSAPAAATDAAAQTTFAIGAYAGEAQLLGEYTNVINFTAVTNIVTE